MSRKPVKLLALSLTLIALTGCAANSSVHDYCLIAKPIYDSPLDTKETRDQILVHNSDYVCACEGDCS